MKTKLFLLVLSTISLMSCDTNEDNNPTTICDAKFYSFHSQIENTTVGDMFNVGYLNKINTTNNDFSNLIPNNLFSSDGYLFYPTSSLKDDNSQLVCLANKTGGKRLFKANLNTLTVVQNNTISSDLSAPVFINNDLRFLKITNKTSQYINGYNQDVSFSAELVDELGVSFSGLPQTINLPTTENGFRDSNIEGVFLNNKVYFLANCQLIVYDIVSTSFSVHTIETYNDTNDRKFIQGLEISSSNTLLYMRQSVLPTVKIEIVELPAIASNVFTSNTLFNLQQSNFPSSAPLLSAIINTFDRRSTTYDKCDNKYYFTYPKDFMPNYNTNVYEVDLNVLSITNYSLNDTFFFGFELEQ